MNRIKPLSVLMAAALLLSGCASVYTADELAKLQAPDPLSSRARSLMAVFDFDVPDRAPDGSAVVLGPAPLAVVKVNNRYRYRVIIYGKKLSGLRGIVSGLVIECCTDKRFSDVSVYADNDPAE